LFLIVARSHTQKIIGLRLQLGNVLELLAQYDPNTRDALNAKLSEYAECVRDVRNELEQQLQRGSFEDPLRLPLTQHQLSLEVSQQRAGFVLEQLTRIRGMLWVL
jgi:hypothetical protein